MAALTGLQDSISHFFWYCTACAIFEHRVLLRGFDSGFEVILRGEDEVVDDNDTTDATQHMGEMDVLVEDTCMDKSVATFILERSWERRHVQLLMCNIHRARCCPLPR